VSNRRIPADLLCESDQPLFHAFGSEADLARFARRSSKASLYEVAVEGDARPAKERRFTILAALLRLRFAGDVDAKLAQAAEAEVEGLRKRIAELEAELADMRPYVRPHPPKTWICVKEAAERKGVSIWTVYFWARRGRIISTKVSGQVWIDPVTLPN